MGLEIWIGYAYVKLKIEIKKTEEIIEAHNHNILKCSFVTISCWVFTLLGF